MNTHCPSKFPAGLGTGLREKKRYQKYSIIYAGRKKKKRGFVFPHVSTVASAEEFNWFAAQVTPIIFLQRPQNKKENLGEKCPSKNQSFIRQYIKCSRIKTFQLRGIEKNNEHIQSAGACAVPFEPHIEKGTFTHQKRILLPAYLHSTILRSFISLERNFCKVMLLCLSFSSRVYVYVLKYSDILLLQIKLTERTTRKMCKRRLERKK